MTFASIYSEKNCASREKILGMLRFNPVSFKSLRYTPIPMIFKRNALFLQIMKHFQTSFG